MVSNAPERHQIEVISWPKTISFANCESGKSNCREEHSRLKVILKIKLQETTEECPSAGFLQ